MLQEMGTKNKIKSKSSTCNRVIKLNDHFKVAFITCYQKDFAFENDGL